MRCLGTNDCATGGLSAWRASAIRGAASLAVLMLVLYCPNGQAQTCTATAMAPVFGVYQPSGSATLANGSITVTCMVPAPLGLPVNYSLSLSMGGQPSAMQRQLAAGSSRLGYNMYCDSAYTQIWADGSNASCVGTGGTGSMQGSVVKVFQVYGRIPAGQYVPAGSYSDAVSVNLLY